jgi:hypothetical protein
MDQSPSKDSYQMSQALIALELIPNRQRPKRIIRNGKRSLYIVELCTPQRHLDFAAFYTEQNSDHA